MTDEELENALHDRRQELFNLRFQLSMGVAKNPSRINQARKDLARAHTVLREKKGGPRG